MTDTEEFHTIEVQLSDSDKELLVTKYIESNLTPASIHTYHLLIAEGITVCEAVHDAILNEIILQALRDEIINKNLQEVESNDEC